MSACNNLLWAGIGVVAGYALALYIDQREDDQEDTGEFDAPDLRVVDEEGEPDGD